MADEPRWVAWEQLPNGEWAEVGRTRFRQAAQLLALRQGGRVAVKRVGDGPPSLSLPLDRRPDR